VEASSAFFVTVKLLYFAQKLFHVACEKQARAYNSDS